MARTGRPGMSKPEKEEVWERWCSGESFSKIGRAVNKPPGSIFTFLQKYGGIRPQKKKRSCRSLSFTEREEISRGIAANLSLRQIARNLNRSPSTICREIKRHGGISKYRALKAEERALVFAQRPKPCKLKLFPQLQRIVSKKLSLKWSPEQIAGWLKRMYPMDPTMQISHETIYRSLFVQSRGALKKELIQYLRTKRKMRQSKQFNTKGVTRGRIIDGISIKNRPSEIEDRTVPGHWEGDLIAGSKNSHIATLVERLSRFTMLVKVEGKDTISVTSALAKQLKQLPENLRKTLTWDRGMELACHQKFTVATNVRVYFCDPQSPWQRGTNENTNGLIRQYLPKKTDLSVHSQDELDLIADQLNQRPRKILRFLTPSETLWESVALTG